MTLRSVKKVSVKWDLGAESWDWAEVHDHCLREARRILKSSASAEDAAQEAVLRAWRVGTLRSSVTNRAAWLTRIARNEALRTAGREAAIARRRAAGDEALDLPAAPDGHGAWAGEHVALEGLLDTLPKVDRQLLRLRYVEDLTQREIAERVGIPEGTVKVKLHRARKRLAQQLEDKDDSQEGWTRR